MAEPIHAAAEAARAAQGAADPAPGDQQLTLAVVAEGLFVTDDARKIAGELLTGKPAGRGRPVGSRNRRTLALSNLILSTRKDPVLWAADIVTLPTDALAELLDCKLLEAVKLQADLAQFVAQYVHQKMPSAVDLTIDDVSDDKRTDEEITARILSRIKTLQDQGVSIPSNLLSNAGVSNAAEKPAENSHSSPAGQLIEGQRDDGDEAGADPDGAA